MTTARDLHAAVLAALRGIPTMQTYDGDVPASPPATTDGRVYPYAVTFPGAATPTPEADVAARPRSELAWEARVTVAAGEITWVLDGARLVRERLHLVDILPGVRMVELDLGAPVQKDTDTTPERWFVPLAYRCLTP